ncbi:helix-turn-helix transcriptional regulator [Aeribacillus sp. FSL K6-2848]|uniref:helix-turn-helix domain-containing protein n=1 Tax=Bacillales TaxID=1385 RepID=UPI0030FD0468
MKGVDVSLSNDIRILFGKNVRKIRISMGISQEELAFRCGLHRTYISDIERGTRNVSLENIERIAHALNVPPKDLFDFSSIEPKDDQET